MNASLATWMAELPSDQTALPLCFLKIPGSHDSGATPMLDANLPVANDSSVYVHIFGKAPCVRKGIKRWAVTQSQSIRGQLDLGVRYLDFRISYPAPDVRISDADFRLVHALYGPSLREVLQQVVEFLAENTKEVVILDMNHLFNMDKSTYAVLQNEAVALLGKDQICPFMDMKIVSLDFMWRSGYRVIIISSFIEAHSTLFWPPVMISSPWPNTNKVDDLLKFLESNLEHRRYNPFGFFVTQGICTPRKIDVIRRWYSTLRTSFSLRTTENVLDWLENLSKDKQQKVNIVILDFVGRGSSHKIISLNCSSTY